jgi:5'-nucleotidase
MKMNILITNDDGWGVEGIEALVAAASQFGNVWVIAPAEPMSGISHQLTFEKPMTLLQKDAQSFSLTGTPADCVRVGMSRLDVEFDWVLSGINCGANLGADVDVSGTVAAAREATLFGKPAIAFSQYLDGFRQDFNWKNASQLASRVLTDLIDGDLQSGQLYNVNFPDTKEQPVDGLELVRTENDRLPLPVEYQDLGDGKIMYCGRYADRPRTAGKDVDVCFGGKISISQL